MATYNGEKFIVDQMVSILRQLSSDDEVIVLDDASKDNTVKILKDLNDPRIKIFKNEKNRGHVYSFSKVVSMANNEIIMMADQDDIWINGRVLLMKEALISKNVILATSNTEFMDANGNPVAFKDAGVVKGVEAKNSYSYFKNVLSIFIGNVNYCGCAMAFCKELNDIILPIPSYVESHDLWIAMAANLLKSNLHLDEKTLIRRIHGENASIINRNFSEKINSRLVFIKSYLDLKKRIRYTNLKTN
jgi:glycosyltransferase involved in cell wall biosynthesis